MITADFEVDGEPCRGGDLMVERARDFALLVHSGASPNASVVDCRKSGDGTEAVVVELRSTVPQRPAVPIRRTERLAVRFRPDDVWYPDVRPLRTDFPRERVLHLFGGVPDDQPVSLCLFAEPWADVRLRLTANGLLFRLQGWLSDTAAGTLHRPDQPLEPAFLARSTPLIVGADLMDRLSRGEENLELDVIDPPVQALIERRPDRSAMRQAQPALVVVLKGDPHEHSLTNSAPASLAELHRQLTPMGLDLIQSLQLKLIGIQTSSKRLRDFGFIVLLVLLQRKRDETSDPELELAPFVILAQDAKSRGLEGLLRDIGVSDYGTLDPNKDGRDVPVGYLDVRYELTPEQASLYSGLSGVPLSLAAVGAGAIGSQFIMTAVREGIANWTVIDEDLLLPHNLVRHALSGAFLGHPKAVAVAQEANSLLDKPTVSAICADVERPGDQKGALDEALAGADAIVDLSASQSVAKHLASEVDSNAKRCSVFISPSGKDLVFLGEDALRKTRLDNVEAQYYRAVVSDPSLSGHLAGGSTVGSCRQVTSRVPQSLVGQHAAIGARALRKWLDSSGPVVRIVRTSDESLSATEVLAPLGAAVEVGRLGGWRIETDSLLLSLLREQRQEALSNETGGVLLAQFDAYRKVIYVSHQIPAPSDSEKQPTVYIRGRSGLADEYKRIQEETRGELVYIGEWHSHPEGSACSPSATDLLAGAWLADECRSTSLPGLMMIVGDGGQTCWMLCSMGNEEGSFPTLSIVHGAEGLR